MFRYEQHKVKKIEKKNTSIGNDIMEEQEMDKKNMKIKR